MRIKWWRLTEKETPVVSRIRLPTITNVEETWKRAANTMLQGARLELDVTKLWWRKIEKQARVWTDDVRGKDRKKKRSYRAILNDKVGVYTKKRKRRLIKLLPLQKLFTTSMRESRRAISNDIYLFI